jgi:hypothetical protein
MQKQILNYFLRNPLAADTLEGVARWRLLDEFVRSTVEETREELRWLVGEGFLSASSATGTETTFRLNAARRGEARQFLGTAAEASHTADRFADDDSRPTANRRAAGMRGTKP